jgi:hypothetical protein
MKWFFSVSVPCCIRQRVLVPLLLYGVTYSWVGNQVEKVENLGFHTHEASPIHSSFIILLHFRLDTYRYLLEMKRWNQDGITMEEVKQRDRSKVD